MTHTPLEHQLDLVEQQFNEVSFAVLDGNPVALQAACAGLQQAAVGLIQLRNNLGQQGALTAPLEQRVKALASGILQARDGMHRRAALVDRALQMVVPSTEKASTYAGENAPYGSAMRQSGVFRVVAA